MNQHFIPLLREAHAVHTAYLQGATTVQEYCAKARLRPQTVLEWTRLLSLPCDHDHIVRGFPRSNLTNLYHH